MVAVEETHLSVMDNMGINDALYRSALEVAIRRNDVDGEVIFGRVPLVRREGSDAQVVLLHIFVSRYSFHGSRSSVKQKPGWERLAVFGARLKKKRFLDIKQFSGEGIRKQNGSIC